MYAATHFIGRYRVKAADVNAGSGIDMLAYTLADFAQPVPILDAFLCLVAVGVLLGMVRALHRQHRRLRSACTPAGSR